MNISSKKQFLSTLEENYDRNNCATSVYSKPQIEAGIVDTIFVEIDARNIEIAAQKSRMIQMVLDKRNIIPRIYFSGSKGFHFYIDFPPTRLKHPGEAVRIWMDENIPKFYDTQTAGNTNQLARVPYTRNLKSGLYACRVGSDFRLSSLFNPKVEFDIDDRDLSDLVANDLIRIDEDVPNRPKFDISMEIPKGVPECIQSAIIELKTEGELSHQKRFHLAAYLNKVGLSAGSIVKMFEDFAKDFKMNTTKYQVNYIARRDLGPYNCKKALFHGVCPLDSTAQFNCPFYPYILLGEEKRSTNA